MSEPTIAMFLLHRFCRDEALVGDIVEEFEHRQSRLWLWRQVAVVVLLGLPYGLIKRPRFGGKMPMPIGGLGLIAIGTLITMVAPGAWWLLGVGALGGFVIGGVLVATRRRHALQEGGRRNILLPVLLACTWATALAAQTAPVRPAVGVDSSVGIGAETP